MSKDLAKSPEMLQKEALIADLQQGLKKKKSTLKGLKTRLKNTREKIETLQREKQMGILHKMEDADKLRIEIAALSAQLKKSKDISREEREELSKIADGFTKENLGDEFEEYKARRERMASGDFDYEEEFGDRVKDIFEQFKVQPDETEKRNIRKVFLNLSKKFHPDKAETSEQAEEHHSVMQRINAAYQNNDIETLLEMERYYLMEEPDFEQVDTVDALQQKIDYLERELVFISNQVQRTSEEINNLRQSDIGKMLTIYERAEREGEGLGAMEEHLDMMIGMFTKLKEALLDSIEQNEISPKINDFLMEMMQLEMEDQDMEGDLNDIMFDEMFDDFDDTEYVENQKFLEGSSVRVVKSVKSEHDKKINMKGWEGRVNYAYYEDNEEIMYSVMFDGPTMDAMPDHYIREILYRDEPFQTHPFSEKDLKAVQPRDLLENSFAMSRKYFHKHNWAYLPKKQANRIMKIMMAEPQESDQQNWWTYLKGNLKLPVQVETLGHLMNAPGYKSKIVDIEESVHPEDGILVYVQRPDSKEREIYPLVDLMCSKTHKNYQILGDYQEWAEEILEIH